MSATPEQMEQAGLTAVAMLTATYQSLPAEDIWNGLDSVEQGHVAMILTGCLIAAVYEKAAVFGVTVEMVLEALAGSALAEGERRRRTT